MSTQIGTTLDIGAGTITGSYIVDTRDESDFDVDSEDVFNGNDGARETRIIHTRDEKTVLNLICVLGATPEVDFPKGAMATHVDFTDLFVDDCRVSRSKGAKKVSVTLTDLGIA